MSAEAPARLVVSAASALRLDAATTFLASLRIGTEVLLVGASRAAADDLARAIGAAAGATFGLHRLSLSQLAARLAAPALADRGLAPATSLGGEAATARALFDAERAGGLAYLAPLAGSPGLPAAVAATLRELHEAGVAATALADLPATGRDLAALLPAFTRELAEAAVADRAALLALATEAVRAGVAPAGFPLVLLDVPVTTRAEAAFVSALLARAPTALVTVPAGDDTTLAQLPPLPREDLGEAGDGALVRLRRHLFDVAEPPTGAPDGAVVLASAPGEGRECVEIARLILLEARRGVPFDAIAVLLRAPEAYAPLLQPALDRAGIPAYVARGARRPDPAGRAFLALLACRAEGFSARRFAEYLSLGQVPALDEHGAPPERVGWAPSDDELLAPEPPLPTERESQDPASDGDGPVDGGSLRAPWRWEELLVEAAVIGGRDRWARRLAGLGRELARQVEALRAGEPESPRAELVRREITNLGHLTRFALPVIDALAALPDRAPWSAWLDALAALAPRVLHRPERVLAVLTELSPMGAIGPVTLDEVQRVLLPRLTTLEGEPPRHRHGRVFVGTPADARGRVFTVVFVPGLAERLFPERPREDPMLLDRLRVALGVDAGLPTQERRAREERLLLRLSAGAARERLILTYPRLDVSEGRARVPSFYALEVARAVTGRIPDVDTLEREAGDVFSARLDWPAPADPVDAVDDAEYDLAVLGALFRSPDPRAGRGRARYLVTRRGPLGRVLRSRYRRWRSPWTPADGLVDPAPEARAFLEAHRLGARPYSLSALQRFAACPYQFLLGAILRLEPRREPVAIERLDATTRGSLVHQLLAELLRRLAADGLLPLTSERLPAAEAALEETFERVRDAAREELAPAIPRVFEDETNALRAEVRLVLRSMADAARHWTPVHFELGFGLPGRAGLDPASVNDPVTILDRYPLRGAVDLVERRVPPGTGLRVTDYKTGRNRTMDGLVVGHGEVLQPVFYSLAVEQALGEPVTEARLWFCTERGGYAERIVGLNPYTKGLAGILLTCIDGFLERGFLPPAPRKDACTYCDFREVCGPREEFRLTRKDPAKLDLLLDLRTLA